jgi:glutathione S-transferase
MATVELYHFWSSVCSVRCRMALEEKGVVWTSRYIDLFKFDRLRPDYLTSNPKGVVPALVHNGQPVRESSVINEYIDAAFEGPKLTPSEPLQAARMREFVTGPPVVVPTSRSGIVASRRGRPSRPPSLGRTIPAVDTRRSG